MLLLALKQYRDTAPSLVVPCPTLLMFRQNIAVVVLMADKLFAQPVYLTA